VADGEFIKSQGHKFSESILEDLTAIMYGEKDHPFSVVVKE